MATKFLTYFETAQKMQKKFNKNVLDGISYIQELASFRTPAFPNFRNWCRSERQHFRDSGISIVPNAGISETQELVSLRTPAFPTFRN